MTLINISFSERFNKKNIRIGEYCLGAFIKGTVYMVNVFRV